MLKKILDSENCNDTQINNIKSQLKVESFNFIKKVVNALWIAWMCPSPNKKTVKMHVSKWKEHYNFF